MPAQNVTVSAEFVKVLDDRTPAHAGQLTSLAVNATQNDIEANEAGEINGKSYTTLVSERHAFAVNLDESQKKTNVYVSFDFKLKSGETADKFTFAATNGGDNLDSNLGPQFHFETGDAVKIAGSDASGGHNRQVTATVTADKWYHAVIQTVKSANAIDLYTINIYELDESDAVGTEAVLTETGLHARNTASSNWINLNSTSVTGTPRIDNFYAYTDALYDATVKAVKKDSSNEVVEGVAIKLNDLNESEGVTAAETGVASFKLPIGEYTVTASKDFFSAPEEPVKLKVEDDGATATVEMTEIPSIDVTFSVSNEGVNDNFTVEVKKGEKVVEPTVPGGKTYKLEQGGEYEYTVTPTGEYAASLDPKTETFNANSATQSVTLTVKTYSLTFKDMPQYAKITFDGTEYYTDKDGKYEGADLVISKIGTTDNKSYKIEKGGYTTVEGTTGTEMNEDKEVTISPATEGTIFYEDFETTGISDGSPIWDSTYVSGQIYLRNHSNSLWMQNGGGTRSYTYELPRSTASDTYKKYTIKFDMTLVASTKTGKLATEFLDGNDKVVAGFGFNVPTANTTTDAELFLNAGSASNTILTNLGATMDEAKAKTYNIEATVDTQTNKVTIIVKTGGEAVGEGNEDVKVAGQYVYDLTADNTVNQIKALKFNNNNNGGQFYLDNVSVIGSEE